MMNFFQITPTELHLNGPNVGFSSVPLDASAAITGVATFTAIGTASFPYNNVNGSYKFDWYYDGVNIKDTADDSNSNATIETDGVLGISTLTISGLTGSDNKKKVYVITDYIQGPDESIIDYPGEGIGKSTSIQATLTAPPSILITKQPKSAIVGSGNTVTFDIEAEIVPDGGTIRYQWQLDNENLSNGTTFRSVQDSGAEFPIMKVIGYDSSNNVLENFTLDWKELSEYRDFVPTRTYVVEVEGGDLIAYCTALGGGGGASNTRSVKGTAGGSCSGDFTFKNGQKYIIRVGTAGNTAGGSGGGVFGGGAATPNGGGGGGYTGLFFWSSGNAVTWDNTILMGGGGGGSTGDPDTGGTGGGLVGNPSQNHYEDRRGQGGTQTEAGSGPGNAGGKLFGGDGKDSGAGGAGYYGGGSGSPGGPISCGGGGGGSGHANTDHVTFVAYSNGGWLDRAGGVRDAEKDVPRRAGMQEDGFFRIVRKGALKSVATTISGASTPKLTIFSNDENFGGSIICKLSADNVQESPVYSNSISYDVTPARNILEFEAYTNDNKYKSVTSDIELLGEFVLNAETFGSEYGIIQFHARDKDFTVRLTMNAAKGKPQYPVRLGDPVTQTPTGAIYADGGDGGKSVIDIKLNRNEEYTILGISNNDALFLYRKANLIAVIGKGGNGGRDGAGGKGGGVNVNGEGGLGGAGRPGLAGQVITPTLTGVWGSQANRLVPLPTLYSGDTICGDGNPNEGQRRTDGGRTISCTKGRHFIDQGIAPCSDISTGEVQFTNADGTLVQDSSPLYRGFKAGYTVTVTGGAFDSECGDGGAGVNGGGGGRSGTTGGGGGAGYADGSVEVVSSTLGGNNTTNSFIVFGQPTSVEEGLFVSRGGRILILSCATPNRNPTTLQKVTGKVLPDTDTCIDDARWQAFLNLASTTDGYRLTATRNNDLSKIVTPTDNNIRKMLNANRLTLSTSLTGWQQWKDVAPTTGYDTDLLLSWDEDTGFAGTGSDYSGLYWNAPGTGYTPGFAYYGMSDNKPFFVTNYHFETANWWILPPGVPDFSGGTV